MDVVGRVNWPNNTEVFKSFNLGHKEDISNHIFLFQFVLSGKIRNDRSVTDYTNIPVTWIDITVI